MNTIRITLITAIAALALGVVSAMASPATMNTSALVFAGPDSSSGPVNKVGPGQSVDLLGCSGGWCQITLDGITGYVPQSTVSTGARVPPQPQQPQPQPQPQQPGNDPGFSFDFNFGNDNPGPFPPQHQPRPPRPPVERQSGACFYSSTNFRGSSFCLERGQNYDYLPGNWDNAIRSVEVFGRARVDLCRDEDLEGACVTLRSSQGRLPSQLDRRASSLDVY